MCVSPGDTCSDDGGVIDDATELVDMMTIDAPQCADPDVNQWVEQLPITASTNLTQIVVLDGDHDNIPDIIALDTPTSISFFGGNGDGSFGPRMLVMAASTGSIVRKLIVGDFNHDGRRDDLVALQTGATTALVRLISRGDGTYTATEFPLSTNSADIGNAGDVDGDGREDVMLLYAGSDARLQVYLQMDTQPYWTEGVMMATNTQATSMFVGRVNGDALTDVVVTMPGVNQVGLHVGTIENATYALAGISITAIQNGVVQAVAGQLNAAGARAIVTVSTVDSSITYREITGVSGTTGGDTHAVGSQPKAVILANVVGDALPDIITADGGSDTFTVLRNQNGAFVSSAMPTSTSHPIDLVAGDFDRDGRLDVAVANASNQIRVFLNKCLQ